MGEDVKLTKLTSCAGCGAKVGAGVLAKILSDLPTLRDDNLLVGFDKSDDAAVYRIKDDLALVQTLDFFPPIADDPFTFGQIAATNALSDIYAMGGEPKLALNIMCVPKSMPKEAVHEILRGGYEKCAEAGAIICGGHSIYDEEPKYGLSVTGFVHPGKLWKNHGAKPGDVLLLTKPLGIGVLTAAQRGDLLEPETRDQMIRLMTTLNKDARDVLVNFDVHACTDVTGFSFLGHLYEMCSGSSVSAEINVRDIALIPDALEFARIGVLPEGMYRNRTFAEHAVDTGDTELAVCDLLFDPQTSGGLLAAVPEQDADAAFEALRDRVPCVQRVGRIVPKSGKAIRLI
ncbi:MAG: selenide, water dikinase SelD [Clostridia bacterium]|nr:selenide, water dikinase SelD [Clostridia bacterium]